MRNKAVETQNNPASIDKDKETRKAMLSLSPEGLKIWTFCVQESEFLSATPSKEATQRGCIIVSGDESTGSWPVLLGPGHTCDCDYSTAYMSLCPCQLCADGGIFILDRFQSRYHQLSEVEWYTRTESVPLYNDSNTLEKSSDVNSNISNLDSNTLEPSSDVTTNISNLAEDSKSSYSDTEPQVTQESGSSNAAVLTQDSCSSTTVLERAEKYVHLNPSLQKKRKRMNYNEVLEYMKPLASLVAKHPHQDMCIGSLEGLKELFQGADTADSVSINDRFQNFLNQFSSHQNCGFLTDNKSESNQGPVFRRKVTTGKPITKRLMPMSEKSSKKGNVTLKKGKRCHFCDDTESHNSKKGCSQYLLHKPYICTGEQVLAISSQLGLPSRYKVTACPDIVANQLKDREIKGESIPWPIGAKHLKLRVVYYDCDDTKAIVSNHLDNIIGVEFLGENGAKEIMNHDNGSTYYYYRVNELQKIIANKIKGERLLINYIQTN